MDHPLLEIRDLTVRFPTRRGTAAAAAVEGVDLTVQAGEVVGVVGESGSGKSVSALAAMGLLPPDTVVSAERMAFDGRALDTMSRRERRAMNGRDLAMIFQEPTASLNPCFTIGFQLKEALPRHDPRDPRSRAERAAALLAGVGITDPERRLRAFPHQMSGGMNQRVMIAMAIARAPRLLIADEPTTALDVTIQRQILDLLRDLRRDRGMAMVLITHDMGVVAEMADRVVVMYAGRVVESGPMPDVLAGPRHPYTRALLDALPDHAPPPDETGRRRLSTIPGVVPGITDRPAGCVFEPRCAHARPDCATADPPLASIDGERRVRCVHPLSAGDGP